MLAAVVPGLFSPARGRVRAARQEAGCCWRPEAVVKSLLCLCTLWLEVLYGSDSLAPCHRERGGSGVALCQTATASSKPRVQIRTIKYECAPRPAILAGL